METLNPKVDKDSGPYLTLQVRSIGGLTSGK